MVGWRIAVVAACQKNTSLAPHPITPAVQAKSAWTVSDQMLSIFNSLYVDGTGCGGIDSILGENVGVGSEYITSPPPGISPQAGSQAGW